MKWDGATTAAVFRKTSSTLSLSGVVISRSSCMLPTRVFPKILSKKCRNVSSYTNVNPPSRMTGGGSSSMVISRSSWMLPIRLVVPTKPLLTITYFSNLPEDQNQRHSFNLSCSDDEIDFKIGKQNLADLLTTSSSGKISLKVVSWAEQYVSNAIQSKRYQITEKSLCALQILIRSCDSSTTKKKLDLVLRFLLHPASTSTTTTTSSSSTTIMEEYQGNTTMATNLPNPLDVILREISISATNISTAPYYAETILDYMEKKCVDDNTNAFFMTPTVDTYNSVMEAWKNSGCCAESTTSSTTTCDQKSSTGTNPSPKHKSSSNVVVLRAQAIYDRMVVRNIQPNNRTLTLLIHLWASSNRSDAAFRATGHLFTLEKYFFQQEKEISVSAMTNDNDSSSTTTSGSHSTIGNEDVRETRYGDDNNMVNNNQYDNNYNVQQTFSISVKEYEAILRAWAVSKRKSSTKRSAMLLQKMTYLHKRGMLPFEPSIECYKAVLTSWKVCDGTDRYEAAEQAMKIISHMLERYDDRAKERQQKEQIPIDDDDQVVLPPDSECFTTALSIMSHSSKRGMAETSQYFLQRMEQLAAAAATTCGGGTTIRPSWVNYTDVIKSFALSKGNNVIKSFALSKGNNNNNNDDDDKTTMNAERVLLRMEQLHDEYGDARVRPHVQSYIATMSAHVKSNAPDKAKQSLFILQHMDERHRANATNPKPTTECYNTVLMACARPPKDAEMHDKQAAFRIALSIMKILMKTPTKTFSSSSNDPSSSSVLLTCNEETFELLLRCCAKLLPSSDGSSDTNKERDNTIRFIFKQACRYGCVNEKVLKELHDAAGKVMYQRLVGTEYTLDDAMEMIPNSWSSNLKTKAPMTMRVVNNNSINVSEKVKYSNGTSYVVAVPETLVQRKNRKILQGGRLT